MSTRTWTAGDQSPDGWPVVVGPDGVTWGHDHDAANEGLPGFYHQHKITHLAGGGATMGTVGVEFCEIFDFYPEGAALREATAAEEMTWIETWESPTVGGAR